jgi:hypothetical protein
MSKTACRTSLLLALLLAVPRSVPAASPLHLRFEAGDIFLSLEPGPVQWRLADGTLRSVLLQLVPGLGEGMAFDAAGNLYVARWRRDAMGLTGNTVEKYNVLGLSTGKVGSGYDCDPHTLAFAPGSVTYVGEGGCRGAILKFVAGQTTPTVMPVAPDNQGVFWMELAPDGCTVLYTSYGPNVKRFDVCTGAQLADFNLEPLPGGAAQDLRVLPDGGVLVSSGEVVARLDAAGALVQTYQGPPESTLYSGLDLVGDDTFWVANYYTSNVYRFDLVTGAVLASFNAGTPPNTVVSLRIKR